MNDETMQATPNVLSETLAAVTLLPWEMERIKTQAEAIYHQAQASVTQYERMGMDLRPIQRASLEDIRVHLRFCVALGRMHQVNVNPDHYFGQTPEQIVEAVEAKAKARRRGAGARAVARKYGDEAAFNITGHRIRR